MLKDATPHWSVTDAAELYEVARWGQGYFSVGAGGTVLVHPRCDTAQSVDLKQLVDQIKSRGVDLPVLIRFNDILQHRLADLDTAFQTAIDEHEYSGKYVCVYPIKVNQQRQVVEQVLRHGRRYGYGLEAGSKPELLAVIALATRDTPIICNGFKDSEFIETAMWAQKIGRHVIPVIEKSSELQHVIEHAQRAGVRPQIGVRVKLAARGAGRWQSSAGYRSKFGLTVSQVLAAVERLKSLGMSDCFQLLHFHLGSQITNIRHIKGALIEAARIYADLAQRGLGLRYLDVGGGLGVDYDGSQTNYESSMNYTLQEYANDVIYHVQTVCDDAGVAHPTIISESGRAVAAYHSVLVFDVLDKTESSGGAALPSDEPADLPQPIQDLIHTFAELNVRNILESFHDAQQALDMAISTFAAGFLPLEQRSLAENLFWAICYRIRQLTEQLEFVPEELQGLDRLLAQTYFCNFSLFQSLPDSWAIKQLFPIMPIHRLQEEPTQQAVLGDVTCDSDGKIDRFVDRRDVRRTLPLHDLNGEPYYLAAFLVGAYQEILGDLHNLFGDTNAVHVGVSSTGKIKLETIVAGDTVSEVLRYVAFDSDELLQKLQAAIEVAVDEQRIDHQQADYFLRFYEAGLQGYTYLE